MTRLSEGWNRVTAAKGDALEPNLSGSGPVTCECGQHRERCLFARQHQWSVAYVDHHTGKLLDKPALHCMPCDSYCGLDDF